MSRASPRYRRVNPSLPPVAPAGGVVLYRVWGSIEGQLTINTFYYGATVPNPTPTQLATLLTNISAALYGSYKGCISSDWTTTKETLDVVHRNDLNGVVSVLNATVPGGRPALHEPSEIAIVVLRKCAVKGQHGRGRIGLPAVSSTDVLSSHTFGAAIGVALALLQAAMLATASDGVNTWAPVMIQRAATSPRLVIGASNLTSITPSALLGTIRRRKIGRGK